MSLKDFTIEELEKELERRELKIPDEIPFKWYLHSQYNRSEVQEIFEDKTDWGIGEDLAEQIYNAFYEVEFNCTLDTRTGRVNFYQVQDHYGGSI